MAKVVALCTGVLLPLPFVLLLWGLLRPDVPADTPSGARISPMLDNEERMRLITYGRHCGPGAECEPPLGCLFEVRYLRSYCTDSQCLTDAQCSEGQVCRNIATWGNGALVRACVPIGPRQEGESCVEIPRDKENACAAGLLCGGQDGWYARPCQPGDTKGCPEGYFCADTIPQPVCLPTCEAQGCPPGQRCIPFKEGSSKCARVYGRNCRQNPCPDDRKCDVLHEPPYPGKVWMACVARCGEGHPPCEAGWVCDRGECVQPCDPQAPEVCSKGYYCHRSAEHLPYACLPDFRRDLDH